MNNGLDEQYIDLLKDILENGVVKETRNGKTLSVFGRTIRYKFKDGKFPLLTTKKMAFKTIVTELIWFLRGSTNIKYLVDNGCNIWNGDAYKYYLVKTKNQIEDPNDLNWDLSSPKDPKITQLTQEQFINKIKTNDEFAKKWGSLGSIYGKQWRSWHTSWDIVEDKSKEAGVRRIENGIDQIQNLINDLKTNPDSRRLLVSAWNPADLDSCVLPPCHYGFQVYTRELSLEERRELVTQEMFNQIYNVGGPITLSHSEIDQWNIPKRAISLMFNMRSTDVGLGLGFNLSSYALLLMIIAKQVNMVPDELIYNGGDVHLYLNHIEPIKEQITRQPYPLPTLKHMKTESFYKSLSEDVSLFGHLDPKDFQIENYQSHPTIKMPLSN